jgi:hypothetical protein
MSVEALRKKQEKDAARLVVLEGKEADSKSRLAGLKKSLGDALYENQDPTAWEVEIGGIQKELLRVEVEKSKIKAEMEKRVAEIESEQKREGNALRLETEAAFSKLLGKAVDLCEKITPLVHELGECAFPLAFADGEYLPNFEALPGFGNAHPLAKNLLSEFIYRIGQEIVAGTRKPTARPVEPAPASRPRTLADVQANVTSAIGRLKVAQLELGPIAADSANKKEPTEAFLAASEKVRKAQHGVKTSESELSTFIKDN